MTHENADFDAIASLLAAHKLYPNAQPVLPHRVNRNVQAFLGLYGPGLPFLTPETMSRGQHVKRVILVDTQKITHVRGMGKDIKDVTIIDHHEKREDIPGDWEFRGEILGATTSLLAEALSSRLIPISPVEATLMLTGIYEDTGSLTYASTTPRDLRAAAWLIDQGANLSIAAEFLDHPLSTHQKKIYTDLRQNAETIIINGHPIVTSWAISPPGTEEEISTLAHKLRNLLDPSALFVLVEIAGNTQLVARSTTDDINVATLADHFEGGGHTRASAALIRQRSVHDVYQELCSILPRYVRPRIKVRDIMSMGVRTVSPEAYVQDVAQLMLRTGHEGFPVVNAEQSVVGLVTRNAVDRAMQHKWDLQPVHRIMQAGSVTTSPEDSAEWLRTLMIHSGWGQIPVVKQGRIIGVVTRTDMIRIPSSIYANQRERIAHLMEEAFPAPLLSLIREIGTEAATMDAIIYFVGGIVRDLLLGLPITDVDIVVEGEAIALGDALARKYGGKIRTHSRFGTVKWILPDDIWSGIIEQKTEEENQGINGSHFLTPLIKNTGNLPRYIDLVTARTEFYDHPTALPTVQKSSIKQDLHRRDFTINTLAIRLDPQRWGEILDYFGGQTDLDKGIIRVLHSLSFIDDPTRILRAARFEIRLGFHLDERSEALIDEAVPLLNRVTGGRIRHELDLIFQERQPEAVFDRLQVFKVLKQINQELVSDRWLKQHFGKLRTQFNPVEWDMKTKDLLFLYWAIFLYRLSQPAFIQISERLPLPRRVVKALQGVSRFKHNFPKIKSETSVGKRVSHIEKTPIDVLAVVYLCTSDTKIKNMLAHYARDWRHIHPIMDGEDLKKMGFKPGPIYRDILSMLKAAHLEGDVNTKTEEQHYIRQHFQEYLVEPT
ncbi:MAG: CBS domain-containing protein [Anaerolineae bacterium]|nr:CBS domain-containing protein [Anaerolineae bacterium]